MWVRAASTAPSSFHPPHHFLLFVLSSNYAVKSPQHFKENILKHNIVEILSLISLGFSSAREASCSKIRGSQEALKGKISDGRF